MILASFSLYGNVPKYLVGAVRNAERINDFGSEWQSVFYLGAEIPIEVETELQTHGAMIRKWDSTWHKNGMFWRFKAVEEFDYDFVIFRDVDSRISERELEALNQWFVSGKQLHIMRDHPHHNALILGGMWGLASNSMQTYIDWGSVTKYGTQHGQDQIFLEREVYPNLKKSAHKNDDFFSFPHKVFRFPSERNGLAYVGESVDENEQFDENLRLDLERCINSRREKLRIFTIFSFHRFRKLFSSRNLNILIL
jgi:hypothetical protein